MVFNPNFTGVQRVGVEAVVEGMTTYRRAIAEVNKGQESIQKEMRNTADESERQAKRTREAWNRVGRDLLIVGGIITAAFGFTIKEAIAFERAFAEVRKTVDATEDEFERLEQGIRDMAEEIPIATNQIAKLTSLAGQLGVEGVEDLLKFTRIVAEVGVATDLSAEQAAFALAQLINITGQSVDELEGITDVLVELGNNTATTESRITDFSLRIAATGQAAGLATDEILAISAAVLSAGVRTEKGSTQIVLGFQEIIKATQTGSDELEVFAKTAGLTAEEFTDLFRRDAAEAFAQFVEGLKALGPGAVQVLEAVGLGGTRATETFLALAETSEGLRDAMALASAELAEGGARVEEFGRFAATASGQLQRTVNVVKNAAIDIGDSLVPALRAGLDVLVLFIGAWRDLPGPIQSFITIGGAVAGVVAVMGGAAILAANQILQLRVAMQQLNITMTGTAAGRALSVGSLVGKAGVLGALATFGFMLGSIIRRLTETDLTQLEFEGLTTQIVDATGKITVNLQDADRAIVELSTNFRRLFSITGGLTGPLTVGEEDDIRRVAEALIEQGTAIERAFTEAQALVIARRNDIELSRQQIEVMAVLTEAGIGQASAFTLLSIGMDNITAAGPALRQAIANAGAALELTSDQVAGLILAITESENPRVAFEEFMAKALPEGAALANDELAGLIDTILGVGDALTEMTARALAADIALELFAAGKSGDPLAIAARVENIFASRFPALVNLVRQEADLAATIEALLAQARQSAGLPDEEAGAGGGGAGPSPITSFGERVAAIQLGNAQNALAAFLAAQQIIGGGEPLLLANLLAQSAESGSDIMGGLNTIFDLFPESLQAIGRNLERIQRDFGSRPAANQLLEGLAILAGQFGGGAGSLPSFAGGGFVSSPFGAGTPVPATLHAGEFVMTAQQIASIGSAAARGLSDDPRGVTIDFTANYAITQSPVVVRDDLERLAMMMS